jgi:hypothetical protein
MPLMELNQASSLNPGADLWVIAQVNASKSSQKLDWYLNFILTKSSLHIKSTISSDLQEILQQTGILSPTQKTYSDRLLIPASHHLPAKWLVQVTFFHDNLDKWCHDIAESWKGLGHPTLRVFLPSGLTIDQFLLAWKSENTFDDFAVVSE